MLIESQDLKAALLMELGRVKDIAGRVGQNKVAVAHVESKRQILETLLVFVGNAEKKGVFDMDKFKLGLNETVKLDDLVGSHSQVEPAIIEEAKALKPGEARPIDPSRIKWPSFSNRVYTMRKEGKLPANVKPLKRGDKFFLVKLKEGK